MLLCSHFVRCIRWTHSPNNQPADYSALHQRCGSWCDYQNYCCASFSACAAITETLKLSFVKPTPSFSPSSNHLLPKQQEGCTGVGQPDRPCLPKGWAPRTSVTLNLMQSGCRTAPYCPVLLQMQRYGEAFA